MKIILIILGIIAGYSIFEYFFYKYLLKNIIYIITNADNIQKKKYKIKRKNIIKCEWDDYKFVVKTKKYIYKFEYEQKEISIFWSIYNYSQFKKDMEKVFLTANLNSLVIPNDDSKVKFKIIKNKDKK